MPSQSQRRRELLVTAVLVGATFLVSLDLFIVNVAFDEIGRDLASGGASLADVSWVLTTYAVVYAALLVPMGRLTDRYGRKGGFIAGLVVFTLASAACGFAGSVWQLVAFRAIQAIGAAALTPASLGLLLAALPEARRAPAARLWALAGAVAAALGPAVGGGLVQISWQWAFWINLPVGVALIVGAATLVPDVRHNAGAPRPDLAGAVLIALGVGALVLGLVEGNDWGWTSGRVVGAFVVAVLAAAAFAWRTTHHPSPVVDPALLRVRTFRWANAATLLFNLGFGANLLAGILWMQQVWGYSALRTGLAVALGPVFVPLTAIIAGRIAPRARPGRLVALGSVLAAAGALIMVALLSPTPAYWTTVAPGWAVTGVAVGLALPNLVAGATASLPVTQVSTGSGVVTMSRQIGQVLGVSLLVCVVGAATDPTTAFRHAWLLVAAASALAALAAIPMEVRRTAVGGRSPEVASAPTSR
ncbi:MFS transporter [Nocardioides mangrovi]|uniref:MFS transporter n=1 Tax=Nocardioides mangrovi TaxID=2874580 RepID=A0ABS7UEK9_9ACTN|nr:MFS transporter [Nocardioides mangrovi]MBZ5739443.1 MFS transporter [Nocardioides mangrovi]